MRIVPASTIWPSIEMDPRPCLGLGIGLDHGARVTNRFGVRGKDIQGNIDLRRMQRPFSIKTKQLRATALDPVSLGNLEDGKGPRSGERRVGKEGVSTCRSRWSQYH